ncbi:Slc35b3 protein, putative [Trichomonas vaginalis G3]|uniref:Slc35b3 protein, putative n=1 Tax=Trichomonas vaginalis (strain ATCC PRA-98 / G3) TaxID=412133 RepID=A2EHR2_TRIV3|nr:3'-phosphoadenosine 5'-phosphosulfate transmembrane transporter protein [Trichomonas vaginalis G3]EAY07752.1 Slc35b3 protein, putative [Trichomonas vaginalis G3]KAI5542978.1 3'-phosphoadenosine 5'-phosphosulfate transmembrane transporter protein [Trichomonas vaginalis G3]|eukprot:XP_001319975.1 Slc35b3 protein [Trichomonas vaginalis G3]
MESETFIFGFDLSSFPRWMILAIGIGGVFGSFLLQGFAHEKIFKKYKFNESLFLTFLQFLCYASLSFKLFYNLFRGRSKLHAPFWFYFVTAFALVSSTALSNFSLERITYPTQVLFRSSKLIPVMLGSFFFLKKRYSILEIVSVFLIVAGLIGISMSDKKVHNKIDAMGLIAIIASLFADAFASNLEEKAFSQYQAPQDEVIAIIYLIGSFLVGGLSVPTGQFTKGIKQCSENPGLVVSIVLFSYLGAIGIQFVYLIIKSFGSVVAVMVTSLRKAFTVCLSFLLFSDKKFTIYHFFSIVIISSGIGLNVYGKRNSKEQKQKDRKSDSYTSPMDSPIENDIGAQVDDSSENNQQV